MKDDDVHNDAHSVCESREQMLTVTVKSELFNGDIESSRFYHCR